MRRRTGYKATGDNVCDLKQDLSVYLSDKEWLAGEYVSIYLYLSVCDKEWFRSQGPV